MISIEERMGPRWSEKELLMFFEGLNKYGRDWSTISSEFKNSKSPSVYPRTDSMIEAVYLKNKTYLSIPSANPTDFSAIMADHYNSFETSILSQEDESKRFPQLQELPQKRLERSFEVKTNLKKPHIKKIDNYDIISKAADLSVLSSRRFVEGHSHRCLQDFVYTPSVFLNDYALGKGEENPVNPKFLQWCKAEWFYSYIDKAFFDHNEFEEALKSLKLADFESCTKYEMQTIRNLIGKPRRFSFNFVAQERRKLAKYREAMKVLQQGKVLPSTYHDMLVYIKINQPSSRSRLMVGQRVIAIHPLSCELRSGSILTLDSCRYHIQFDRPELGVTPVSDISILPLNSDMPKLPEPDDTHMFIYKPIQEREVISSSFVIDGFKAGVNIYAMAFLLKLLERKESLIELLKQYNSEFAAKIAENSQWRPDYDLQQQYAWICVTVQAINTSISKVLEIFRLRNRPPPQPVIRIEQDTKIEQIKDAASSIVMEQELEQRSSQFSESELSRIQESLKNGVVLLGVIDLIMKENDTTLLRHLEENLSLLSPACESNKIKYEEVCRYVEQIKNKLSTR